MSQYKIEAATGQHIGDRSEQQDRTALFAAPKAPGYMMAVLADGMGGMTGGAMAAEQVLRTARQIFENFSPLTDHVETMLESIAHEVHTVIQLSGMSSEQQPHSTMVLLVLTPERTAIWAHVGDSRLYRFSGPNLADRTIDHTFVEQMIRKGQITRAEAIDHKLSNLLANVIGSSTEPLFITTKRYEGLMEGDAFLLCSDGLWAYLSAAEMGAAIAMNSPRIASEMLINKARERAAKKQGDNCTLTIVKLVAQTKEVKEYTAQKIHRAV